MNFLEESYQHLYDLYSKNLKSKKLDEKLHRYFEAISKEINDSKKLERFFCYIIKRASMENHFNEFNGNSDLGYILYKFQCKIVEFKMEFCK